VGRKKKRKEALIRAALALKEQCTAGIVQVENMLQQ
jgi:hypothetical protein